MSNRYYTQFFYSFFKKPVLLAGKIPLSASAAVGTVAIKGIKSVVKSGTGEYTITFEDKYPSLQYLNAQDVDSGENLVCHFKSYDPANKTIILVTKVAGTAANVTDACDIYVSFLFNNSSVG